MARQLVLQNLMKLAQGIGANPQKFMGTRTNITFLGKGPTKNPLFQGPLRGIESATEAQLGSRESIIEAVEDAMGFATANKLNSIQIRALELNLENIFKIYNPPVLPMASVTNIAPGIEGLKRFPKETHKFMGRPLKDKDFAAIDKLVQEGKLPPAPPMMGAVDRPQKTAAARATMIRLLDVSAGGQEGVGVTLREIMSQKSPQDLKWLLEGGGGAQGDPIALFAKYFGNAATRNIPSDATPAVIDSFAKKLMQAKDTMGRRIDDPFFNPEDIPFAHGGLAHILQVPRKRYAKGRTGFEKGGWSPGVGRDDKGYKSDHGSYSGGDGHVDRGWQTYAIEPPTDTTSYDGGPKLNIHPTVTWEQGKGLFTDDTQVPVDLGFAANTKRARLLANLNLRNLYESEAEDINSLSDIKGLLEPSIDFRTHLAGIDVNAYKNKNIDAYNLGTTVGPVDLSYQDINSQKKGDISYANDNFKVGATTNFDDLNKVDFSYNPNDWFSVGGTLDDEGKYDVGLKISKKWGGNKGGLAGILEV